jgi:hypothetical protein
VLAGTQGPRVPTATASAARRLRYANDDMADLERCLAEARDARTRLITTDGVFSMDGTIANLREICDLADRHDALVTVDDSHTTGFMGAGGRGTHEHCGVMGRVDILTGTLGKALGGGSGGYIAARRGATSSTGCASARASTCCRTACHRSSPQRPCACSTSSNTTPTCAVECMMRDLPQPSIGPNDVLITRAGPIGIMAVAIARFVGARHVVITDVNAYRLELAARMGATRTVNVGRENFDAVMQSLGMQEGFEIMASGRSGKVILDWRDL